MALEAKPPGSGESEETGGAVTGPATTPAEQAVEAAPPETVTPTRASATWTAVAAALLFLVVVLVFILQNLQHTRVRFFTASWRIPLGIDLLFAAVLGGLIVLAAGSVRVLQLRRLARRQARAGRGSRFGARG